MDVILGSLPFAAVETVGLVIFIAIPELVLWLPGLMQ
jgi:hypothetical protein